MKPYSETRLRPSEHQGIARIAERSRGGIWRRTGAGDFWRFLSILNLGRRSREAISGRHVGTIYS